MKKLFLLAGIGMLSFFSASAQNLGYTAEAKDFSEIFGSGMYSSVEEQENYPDNSQQWKHLLNISSTKNHNHQLQISGSFRENDRLFFRKILSTGTTNRNSQWHEMATRGANTFIGDQNVDGILTVGSAANPNGKLRVHGSIAQYGNTVMYLGYNDKLKNARIKISTNETSGGYVTYQPALSIRDAEEKTVMHFSKEGNIGIGKSYANHKLEVNGNIRAKGLILETFGWADFVFEPDYELPTLSEVSTHIQEHKHLPGIPSAAEVEENGINVSEIQVKLLQKIEELTLYIIQENKAKQEMLEKISILEDEMRRLKNNN